MELDFTVCSLENGHYTYTTVLIGGLVSLIQTLESNGSEIISVKAYS